MTAHQTAHRFLPYYIVFFLAGMPALVYQVVWQRLLTLYFGVDIYSTAVAVATFMLGLGLGSLAGGRLADRVRRPALVYAGVEIGIGLFGVFSVDLLRWVGDAMAGAPLAMLIPVDFALMLVPTLLMGSTLPLVAKAVARDESTIGRHLSALYGLNTLGAAIGAAVSAYLLIGLLGFNGTVYGAAAVNLTLGLAIILLLGRGELTPATPAEDAADQPPPPADQVPLDRPGVTLGYPAILLLSFLSGLIALGYQLAWYRQLVVLLHGTAYVFGTILFVFLLGLGAGSFVARRSIEGHHCLRNFARSQIGIAAYVLGLSLVLGYGSTLPGLKHLISASFFTSFHPSPALAAGEVNLYTLYSALDVAFWALVIVGPPTVMMGYGLPNLMRAGTRMVGDLGHRIGGIYFANIVGSTLGSLLFGFVVIHAFGTETSLRLLTAAGALTALGIGVALRRSARARGSAGAGDVPSRLIAGAAVLAVMTLALFPPPGALMRATHFAAYDVVDFTVFEDRTGVAALRTQHAVIAFPEEQKLVGHESLYIDGARHGGYDAEASTAHAQKRVSIALAAHPAPRRVLSIGLGDGKMVAAAIADPAVESVTVVELSGVLRPLLNTTEAGRAVLSSPKVTYIVDDGRRWLQEQDEIRFDAIIMWPLHAAHAYYNNLHSREFMAVMARHLAPGGLIYMQTEDQYSTARTAADVFAHVLRVNRASYILSNDPIRLDATRLDMTPTELWENLDADRQTILAKAGDAPLNTDLRPRSEYYLTYPFAAVIAPSKAAKRLRYREEDRDRLRQHVAGLPTAAAMR